VHPAASHIAERYEEARGAPFGDDERTVARGSLVYTMDYTARWEHSDAALCHPAHGAAQAFLAAHGAELLGT
jgi:hypothetical protein